MIFAVVFLLAAKRTLANCLDSSSLDQLGFESDKLSLNLEDTVCPALAKQVGMCVKRPSLQKKLEADMMHLRNNLLLLVNLGPVFDEMSSAVASSNRTDEEKYNMTARLKATYYRAVSAHKGCAEYLIQLQAGVTCQLAAQNASDVFHFDDATKRAGVYIDAATIGQRLHRECVAVLEASCLATTGRSFVYKISGATSSDTAFSSDYLAACDALVATASCGSCEDLNNETVPKDCCLGRYQTILTQFIRPYSFNLVPSKDDADTMVAFYKSLNKNDTQIATFFPQSARRLQIVLKQVTFFTDKPGVDYIFFGNNSGVAPIDVSAARLLAVFAALVLALLG